MSDTSSPAKTTRRRLKRTEWIKIEEKWASGDYTLSELMKRHGVARNTLTTHFKKHGIVKGSRAESHRKAVERQMETRQVRSAEETAEMITKVKTTNLQHAELLNKAVFAKTMRALQGNVSLETVHGEIKTLHEALKAIKCGYDIQASILHLDREEMSDDELPSLTIYEMTAEDVESMREQQRLEIEAIEGEIVETPEDVGEEGEEDDDIIREGL